MSPSSFFTPQSFNRDGTKWFVTFSFLALICIAGCDSVISVYPLCNENDECLIKDGRIVGSWKCVSKCIKGDSGVFVVEDTPGKHYDVTWTMPVDDNRRVAKRRYQLRFVKLGDALLADVTPERIVNLRRVEEYEPLFISGHYIMACSFEGKTIKWRPLDRKRIEECAKQMNVDLRVVDNSPGLLVGIGTKDLQSLLQRNTELFSKDPIVILSKQEE